MKKHASTSYADRFDGLPVAPQDAPRFERIRSEIEEHGEQKRLRSVIVGTGMVTSPVAFTATLLTARGEVHVNRLLPCSEVYGPRRFGAGDPISVVLFTVWNGRQHIERCHLFRQPS